MILFWGRWFERGLEILCWEEARDDGYLSEKGILVFDIYIKKEKGKGN